MPKPFKNAAKSSAALSNEVLTKTKRRTFSAAEKRRILSAADACKHGELGALLRAEKIYHTQLVDWRKQLSQGDAALSARRGPVPKLDAKDRCIAALERTLAKANRELVIVNAIVELQKKAQNILSVMRQGDVTCATL